MLVSNKLTSDRPMTESGGASDAIGSQQLESRLWEDPFKQSIDGLKEQSLAGLCSQIKTRMEGGNCVTVMPVMIGGGAYSEDREARIRSRFSIVSALGRSGYAPEDAEHLGAIDLRWPTTADLDKWITNTHALLGINKPTSSAAAVTNYQLAIFDAALGENHASSQVIPIPGLVIQARNSDPHVTADGAEGTITLKVRYEWYRLSPFSPESAAEKNNTHVLLLWLDDSSFEDEPLLRLPLLLKPLVEAATAKKSGSCSTVQLIGPRRSSSLRAMLPGEFGNQKNRPLSSRNPTLWKQASQVLNRVTLHSATVSAMDPVLVEQAGTNSRVTIRQDLCANGFAGVSFYNATDAELASQVLDELRLRGVDMSNPENHLVLLSEWDTFYGRMLSLTYAASVAVSQTNPPPGLLPTTDISQFVREHWTKSRPLPPNFHSYAYLRGLDGKTVGRSDEDKGSGFVRTGANKKKPQSIDDLVNWKPEANRAEGPSQFDYLGRTGEDIESLQEDLKRRNQGSVKAIGIVGSDVYDVLLILQALRNRFPAIYFFTTDLDARYLQPNERPWARNLIVVGSHGLRLHPDFQGNVAPFRDSSETAQFAAVLGALHPNDSMTNLTRISPRRFEIGNHAAIDLSPANQGTNRTTFARIHPLIQSEADAEQLEGHPSVAQQNTLLLLLLLVTLVVYFWWNPIRHRTYRDYGILSRNIPIYVEDVGDDEGAAKLIEELRQRKDPFCVTLATKLNEILFNPNMWPSESFQGPHHITREQETKAFVELLNRILNHELLLDECSANNSNVVTPERFLKAKTSRGPVPFYNPIGRLHQRWRTRKMLDELLTHLSTENMPELEVAKDARLASERLCWIRFIYFGCCVAILAIVVYLGFWLDQVIWVDTYRRADGEPFSFTSGVSSWPNLILRLVSTIVASSFIVLLFQQLRVMFYDLSRRYRIGFTGELPASQPGRVCASALWRQLQRGGRVEFRLLRAGIPCALYFAFGYQILLLSDLPFSPVRGDATSQWEKWSRYPFVVSFLLLCFLTIDAALRCRKFIRNLSEAPTDYPKTTRAHFQSSRGDVGPEYLDEWIDTQLIADLTERVGGLLWLPGMVFLLMLAARNTHTDHWPLSSGLLIIIGLNFVLATTSVVILQRAARRAKKLAEDSLYSKVKRLKKSVAATPQENDADQAEKLLDEIRNIRRGAFAGFWENPVVGAVLLPSGGTALLQVFGWLVNR